MESTATTQQRKRILLTREQNIILASKIRDYSTHIITSRPRLVDFVKMIAKEMGCEVSQHAVRETFLVLNKDFTEWPKKELSGKDRHKSRKTLSQVVKSMKTVCEVLSLTLRNQGLHASAKLVEQCLVDLDAVEKNYPPDLFAGVGS